MCAASISNVSVNFSANTAGFTQGLTDISNKLTKFSTDTKSSLAEVNSGLASISKSLGPISSAMGAFGISLSVGALVAFGKSLLESAANLTQLSQRLGISTDDLQDLQAAALRSGLSINDVATFIDRMEKNVESAADGNVKMSIAFNKIGLSVKDLKSMSPDEIFLTTAKAVAAIQDPIERAAAYMTLFGRKGTEIAPLVTALQNTGDTVKVSEVNIKTLNDTLNAGALAWHNFTASAGNGLAEIITKIKQYQVLAKAAAMLIPGGSNPLSANLLGTNQAAQLGAMGLAPAPAAAVTAPAAASTANTTNAKMAADASAELAKSADVFMASVDPASKYREELEEIATATEKYNLTAAQVKELQDALGNSFREAYDPVFKYNQEILKSQNSGLSVQEQSQAIDNLNKKWTDVINPVQKYKAEIDAINGSKMTADQKSAAIADLGSKYTDAIGPLGQYTAQIMDMKAQLDAGIISQATYDANLKLMSTDAEASLDPFQKVQQEYEKINSHAAAFRSDGVAATKALGDEFKLALTPAEELDAKIQAIEAHMQINAGQGVASVSQSQGTAAIAKLQSDYDISKLADQAKLLNDPLMAANAQLAKTTQEINSAFGTGSQGKIAATRIAFGNMWLAAHPVDMQVIQSFGDNFAAGLEDAISGAKSFGDAMRDVLKSLATEILDVIIKQEILANLFNLILPGSSGGTAMFGGGAATLGRATGGPVGANIAYTVGENGQETFIPATNGYILPNTATTNSGGSNSQITQNIYVSAGVAASVKQEMYNLLPQFQQSTMNAIVQAKQCGGVFATRLAA